MSYGNAPTREPDISGAGRAWRVTAKDPEEHAGIGADWLVHAPFAHPFWWWYAVSAIHLRPLPGKGPAHIRFPGATHEILFVALNPEKPLPDISAWQGPAYLTPIDLEHQFIVQDDEKAREITDLVVAHICEGVSPDQDFRAYWRDVINRTAEHARLGGHPA